MNIIEINHLIKKFKVNGITACDSINLSLKTGETIVLMGENGAGKSTLVSLIEGSTKPDKGSLVYKGRGTPGLVHQKPRSAGDFQVWQHIGAGNICLTGLIHGFSKKLINPINEFCDKFECQFTAESFMADLHSFQVQQVELIEQILLDRDLIILDEPEFPHKNLIIDHLRDLNKTLLIVTHRIEEALKWGERLLIMRRGKIVYDRKTKTCDEEELLSHFIPFEDHNPSTQISLSPDMERASILVIVGLRESGLEEEEINVLSEHKGTVLGYLPSQYRHKAMEGSWSVIDNVMIHNRYLRHNKAGLINRRKWLKEGEKLIQKWSVRAEGKEIMSQLSGGNQKKILLMRELCRLSDLIILANPSIALDLDNRKKIYTEILKAREAGKSFIILTDDPLEALELGDEIIPLYNKKRGIRKKASFFDKESLTAAMRGSGEYFG